MAAKIKICGITNPADGRLALDLGADWLGFNFYKPSPRYIEPAAARDIIKELKAETTAVGLFVDSPIEHIEQVVNACPLAVLQLHGRETNEDCLAARTLGLRIWKAIQIQQPTDMQRLDLYDTDAILLDAFHPELHGGTGRRFDWSWITDGRERRIILAGGITPDNITEALSVRTYGIDLCSGVESKPGVKDPAKMKRLFRTIADHVQQRSR